MGLAAGLGPRRYPSPLVPAKALLGAGFAKWLSQNLVFKELRYQNLENKQLKLA